MSTKKKERDSLNKSTATVHKKIVDRILPPPKKKSIKKKKKRKESCEKKKEKRKGLSQPKHYSYSALSTMQIH